MRDQVEQRSPSAPYAPDQSSSDPLTYPLSTTTYFVVNGWKRADSSDPNIVSSVYPVDQSNLKTHRREVANLSASSDRAHAPFCR